MNTCWICTAWFQAMDSQDIHHINLKPHFGIFPWVYPGTLWTLISAFVLCLILCQSYFSFCFGKCNFLISQNDIFTIAVYVSMIFFCFYIYAWFFMWLAFNLLWCSQSHFNSHLFLKVKRNLFIFFVIMFFSFTSSYAHLSVHKLILFWVIWSQEYAWMLIN